MLGTGAMQARSRTAPKVDAIQQALPVGIGAMMQALSHLHCKTARRRMAMIMAYAISISDGERPPAAERRVRTTVPHPCIQRFSFSLLGPRAWLGRKRG